MEIVNKPRLSFWQLWNMSIGFLGIQWGFQLLLTNQARIFQALGAEVDKLAILAIAGPITGLLVQPVIGYLSDRTWSRWGRRRPYFFIGAVLASLALIGLPNSANLWVAVVMLWILDASINISMEPFRAFVGDMLPKEQMTRGFSFQTFFIGIGAIIGTSLPFLLATYFNVANTAEKGSVPPSVIYAFYFGALAYILSVLWTIIKTKEYDPEQMRQFHPDHEEMNTQTGSSWKDFFTDFLGMPKVMAQLAVVQFFTWFALYCFFTFTTPMITQHIFNTSDTSSAIYNQGANWAGICNSVYSFVSVIAAFLLPVLAAKISRKGTHMFCLAIGGLSLMSMYFVTDPIVLLIPFIGIGLAWASILSMPYTILACTLSPNKRGVYMGMFNMFIVIPQSLAGLVLGPVLTHFFHGNTVLTFVLAGLAMLLASASVIFVQDRDD